MFRFSPRVEEEAVATEAMPFEGDGVADAQSAPAHQQRHSAEPCAIRIGIDESAAIVTDVVGGVDDAVEFFRREVVRGDLDNLDLAQSEGRVFLKIPAPHAGPEETDHSALLLLLCQSGISPGAAKVQKCVKVDFIEIGKPLRLRRERNCLRKIVVSLVCVAGATPRLVASAG